MSTEQVPNATPVVASPPAPIGGLGELVGPQLDAPEVIQLAPASTETGPLSGILDHFGQRRLLVAADVVVCLLAVAWGTWYTADYRFSHASFAIALLASLGFAGLYRPRLSLSLLDIIPALVGAWLVAIGLGVTGQVIFAQVRWGGSLIVDWGALRVAAVTLVGLTLVRLLVFTVVKAVRTRGLVAHRTLIVGTPEASQRISDVLMEHHEYGLVPVGFLDESPPGPPGRSLRRLGRVDEVAHATEVHHAHIVIVGSSSLDEPDLLDRLRGWNRLRCDVFVVPRLSETHNIGRDTEDIWGIPLVRLRRASYRTVEWRFKRAMDIVVAASALVLLSPLMAAIAVAVRLEGGPGFLFRQERVGVGGGTFALLKFRSLRPIDDVESATHWNVAKDDRLGKVGKFLRKSSLDELPQLYNILRGDMSLVGPRPERPYFVQQYGDANRGYHARHRVPAGLTGWAQIHGLRGDTSIADRARFDNFYIENWSLWLDIKILIRTVTAVLRGSGG